MKVLYLISLLLTISCSVSGFQQQAMPESDRVYVSLDKPYHAAGEHIGFTVYLLDRLTHQLQETPRIVFLELFHPQGSKLLSQVIRTEKGRGTGRLLLPDTLSAGIYLLAAYTQKMSLEDEPKLAWKEIFIDGEKTLKRYVNNRDDAVQLSFSPEGGKLVEGLDNLVGIQLLDAASDGMAAEGELMNNKGEVIARFSTSVAGTGSVNFTPRAGFSYYGKITLKGRETLTSLPPAEKEGFVLQVDDSTPDSLRILVAATPALYGEHFQLRILSRGITILETSGQARHYGYRIKVPVASLLPGIGYVQLLSETGELLANRPVYLDELKHPAVTINTATDRYPTRTEVALQIQVKDEAGRPLSANFSASVFDKKYTMPGAFQADIQQQIQVAGEINTVQALPSLPSLARDSLAKEMDNFLLTAFADTLPVYSPKAKSGYLNVLNGRLLHKDNAKPLADTTLLGGMVIAGQKAPVLLFAKTDRNGRFSMTLPPVSGSSAVYLKVKGVDEMQDVIEYQVEHWGEETAVLENRKQINSRYDMRNTTGYYRTFRENELINQAYASPPLSVLEDNASQMEGHSFQAFDAIYRMSEYQLLPTLRDVIIDIISGVRVRRNNGSYNLMIDEKRPSSRQFLGKLPGEPLFLLDGVPVNNPDIIFNLSPADIETIEVAHASWYFEEYPVHGIFAVTTKNKEIFRRKDVYQYTYTSVGASSSIQYKFRQHSVKQGALARIPDFRPLLYYQPMATTNEKGEADFRFFTADDVGSYRILVEGVTADGRLFSVFKDIEVESLVK